MSPEPFTVSKNRLTIYAALVFVVGCLAGVFAGGAYVSHAKFNADKSFYGFLSWLVVDDERVRAFVLGGVLVAAVILFSFGLSRMALSYAGRWNRTLNVGPADDPDDRLVVDDALAPLAKERLKQQWLAIRGRAAHHFTAMVDFSKWYYMSIGTFSLSALVAAIALFFLTSEGWSAGLRNYDLLAVFVVMTGAATFYRSVIAFYRHAENIADNKQLYKNYVALENEVRSFAATGAVAAGGPKTTDDFVAHVDKKMAEFHNIAIGFDASKVPTYDGLLDGLGKGRVAAATAPAAGATAAASALTEQSVTPQPVSLYVVQPGDTLSEISQKFYGDPNKYMILYWANVDRVKDPDLIKVGWELKIPPAPVVNARSPAGADGRTAAVTPNGGGPRGVAAAAEEGEKREGVGVEQNGGKEGGPTAAGERAGSGKL